MEHSLAANQGKSQRRLKIEPGSREYVNNAMRVARELADSLVAEHMRRYPLASAGGRVQQGRDVFDRERMTLEDRIDMARAIEAYLAEVR